MTVRGAALTGAVALLAACSHYNTVYNAERVYREAEGHRVAGRDSLAAAGYADVVRRTAAAYRADPDGRRTGETLFLLGQARLRLGELEAARIALTTATGSASDPALRARVLVYLALALARSGDPAGADAALTEALEGRWLTEAALAEALLVRGSLGGGRDGAGSPWLDLERAGQADGALRVEAQVERLRLALDRGDRERAGDAVTRLLSDDAAAPQLDTIVALTAAAARRWSPGVAAAILADAPGSSWEQPARGRIQLERARLLRLAADTAAAAAEAWRVADGRGDAAVEARLQLARWRLGAARDLGAASSARAILLPGAGHPEAADLLSALDRLDRYAALGIDDALGWFAAGELARDALGARVLARGFFLAYADTDPGDPWTPKALLAALDVAEDGEDRAWLRGRLEAHRDSRYVHAAGGGRAVGVGELEESLSERLRGITDR